MSEPRFTPGPWKWWTSCSWRRLKRDHHRDEAEILMPHVCRDGQPDITVSEANMALIETAPDLYEALEMVRDADEDCKRDGFPTMPPMARAKIDAALSKARGEKT